MSETLLARTERARLPETVPPAWDTMQALTGEPTFVEVFASNPAMLEFVMEHFYAGVFFGGQVDQRYKQLARLKLSLLHGCRTCNRQNVPGALAAGVSQAQIDAMDDYESGPFTDAEKAVLAYADEVALTNLDGRLTPALYRAAACAFLRSRHPRARRRDGGDLRDGQTLLRARPGREGKLLPVRVARRLPVLSESSRASRLAGTAQAGLRRPRSSVDFGVATSRTSSPTAARSCAARRTASASRGLATTCDAMR